MTQCCTEECTNLNIGTYCQVRNLARVYSFFRKGSQPRGVN